MSTTQSNALFKKALQYIPGGVNSPVRAFKQVNATPFFIDHAKGAYLTDIDGNTYIDFVNSWGALLLGHAHPEITEALKKAVEKGTSYGAPHPGEVEFAELLNHLMPSLENVRLVSSGTEATMSAIRLARGFTGKKKIIKFEGCYHGASDGLLVKAGSGVLTLSIPDSAGVPETFAQETLIAQYNDLTRVDQLLAEHAQDIAAIIVEPIAGNMNFVAPLPDFLPGLRKRCDQTGALLIFDEVMTGFRVAPGGAQALYQIQPDLTTLAKIIGGGLPLAAFGGRKEIMQNIAPAGPIYQAGTLSGNPVATAAGLATLRYLSAHPMLYDQLNQTTTRLLNGLKEKAKRWNIPFSTASQGGMFGYFFTDEAPTYYQQVQATQAVLFHDFFHSMLKQGVYFAPSRFEAGFTSMVHTTADIEKVIEKADHAFQTLAEKHPT